MAYRTQGEYRPVHPPPPFASRSRSLLSSQLRDVHLPGKVEISSALT